MNFHCHNARRGWFAAKTMLAAAIVVTFCVLGVLPWHVRAATAKRPAIPDDLKLKPEGERRALALAHFSQGYSAALHGRADKALEHYRRVVELEPNQVTVHLMIADLLAGPKGDLPAAIAHLEKALTQNPRNFELLFRLGKTYEVAKLPDRAFVRYQQAIKVDPLGLVAYQKLAGLYLDQKKTAEAVRILDQAAKQSSNQSSYWMRLGDSFRAVAEKSPEAAQEHKLPQRILAAYEKALALAPTDVQVLYRAAEAHVLNQNLPRAVELYNTILQSQPGVLDVREKLIFLYQKIDGKEKSLAEIDKLLEAQPTNWRLLWLKAEFLDGLKQYDAAVENFRKSLTINPNALELHLGLALTQMRQKKYDDARATLSAAQKLFPRSYQVPFFFGLLYSESKEYDTALAGFELAEHLAGDDDKVKLDDKFYFYYASACERSGQTERAAEFYRKALDINPNDLALHLDLALTQIRLKKYDDARAILAKARQLFPRSHQVPFFFGLLHSDLKEYDKALAEFESAERLAAEDKSVTLDDRFYFYYGAACERTGKIERAAELFRKALQINPKSADAMNYLGYMWADKGVNLDEAQRLITQALEIEPDNGAYLDSLGWVYFKQGKYADALAQLRKAEGKLKEPDPTVFEHLGDVLDKLGQREEAVGYWKKAAELDPKNEELARKLKNALENPGPATQQR
jgi:tetratricopeptide (TPR) repeat protein